MERVRAAVRAAELKENQEAHPDSEARAKLRMLLRNAVGMYRDEGEISRKPIKLTDIFGKGMAQLVDAAGKEFTLGDVFAAKGRRAEPRLLSRGHNCGHRQPQVQGAQGSAGAQGGRRQDKERLFRPVVYDDRASNAGTPPASPARPALN